MENVTLAVAKSYAEELLMGQGAIQGEKGEDGADGVDGIDGVDGFSPIIAENTSNTDEVYKLDITTKDGTFTTVNLIGKQGVQGIQGIQGERGEQGETGLQGQQGIQGVKGEKGDDGYPFLIYKQYEVGIEEFNEADFPEIGLMFMIHVFEGDKGYPIYRYTADGTDTPYTLITYMNTEGIKGEKGDKGEDGAQGIAGLDGKDGADGTTYTPSIGEVTTVDSTELASASVSVNEDTKEAVFNFAIPKGVKGDDGVQIDDTTASDSTVYSSNKITTILGGLQFGVDENGNYGYIKAGADTVTPFKSGEGYNTNYYKGTTTQEGTLPLEVKCGFKPRYVQVAHKWWNNNSTSTLFIANDEIMIDSRVSSWGLNEKSGITIQDDGFYITGISHGDTTITYICI